VSEKPCEALFERLVKEDPTKLVEMLPTLEPGFLTFAAEYLGSAPSNIALLPLLNLLLHPSPVVREGAIYGIYHHIGDDRVIKELNRLKNTDPSPGVRIAAGEALDTPNYD
jgi:hypothetical protein